MNRLDALLESYTEKRGSIIPILQGAQEILGYLPPEAFEKIAQKTGIKISDLYGVATFYAQFRLKPVGKHMIRVCHGTACHVKGSEKLIDVIYDKLKLSEQKHTTDDMMFTVEAVSCLGACGLAPVMVINDKVYGEVTAKRCSELLEEIMCLESEPVKGE